MTDKTTFTLDYFSMKPGAVVSSTHESFSHSFCKENFSGLSFARALIKYTLKIPALIISFVKIDPGPPVLPRISMLLCILKLDVFHWEIKKTGVANYCTLISFHMNPSIAGGGASNGYLGIAFWPCFGR